MNRFDSSKNQKFLLFCYIPKTYGYPLKLVSVEIVN